MAEACDTPLDLGTMKDKAGWTFGLETPSNDGSSTRDGP